MLWNTVGGRDKWKAVEGSFFRSAEESVFTDVRRPLFITIEFRNLSVDREEER